MREQLETILPDIYAAVCKACGNLSRYFDEDDYNRYTQRIALLLMVDDYRLLRSFKKKSSPQTWLYKIAWRNILHWLQEQNRQVSLDDLPPDFFAAPPDQEQALLFKENMVLLQAALGRLSERKRLLFHLICDDLNASEIAEKMDIETSSVYPMRDTLIKKLQETLSADGKTVRPDNGT